MRVQFWKMTSQDGKDLGGIGHGVAVLIVPLASEPSVPALHLRSGGGNGLPRPPLFLHDWG
ncbi:hypothetical protein TBR22_A18940 [Luteitalea sp. TBR-22]|nr:hypothetical protein TBR22_A18940 [Luteitalea sp. TBR-22]